MNKFFLQILTVLLISQKIYSTYVVDYFELEECYVSFVVSCNNKYVVKQIKSPAPDDQFLLVLDALACHIAETAAIPMNRVTIIPPGVDFPGKINIEFPATLHTMAPGVSTDRECRYQDIDVQQRYRKAYYQGASQWGPLPPEKVGFTFSVIQNMAKHPDLPSIVAFDTFVGNADRSAPNLFYDEATDRFCGIDLAGAFSTLLSETACRQVGALQDVSFTDDELAAIIEYTRTLEALIKNWPPEKMEQALLDHCKIAGFIDGSFLYNQDVIDRIEFHKKCMKDNYQKSIDLVALIKVLTNKPAG